AHDRSSREMGLWRKEELVNAEDHPFAHSPFLRFAESISCRHPVFPRFAGPDIDALAVVHFDFDRLVTAVTADIEANVVSFLAQFAHRFVRNAALDFDVAA